MRLPDSATFGQIRSDPTLGEELGFQHTSFTLPPNRSTATEHRWIFVVSDDSDTRPNEDDKERENRLQRNELRADRRCNEAAIQQFERDMENAECRNPMNRCSPIRPRNLDDDFVLNYNGQDVFVLNSRWCSRCSRASRRSSRLSRPALACMWPPHRPSSYARTTRLTAPSRTTTRCDLFIPERPPRPTQPARSTSAHQQPSLPMRHRRARATSPVRRGT